jgi:drug/metabolite transporter (DMT)-like permease
MVWALYSLGCKKVRPFATSALGLFGLVSAVLALLTSAVFEPHALLILNNLQLSDWLYLLLIGLGALGGAFYAWDRALKTGEAQRIGLLAFLTPILSTWMLTWTQGQSPHWTTWLSLLLIVLACYLGSKAT